MANATVPDPCSESAWVFQGSEWGPATAPPPRIVEVVGGSALSACVGQLFVLFCLSPAA